MHKTFSQSVERSIALAGDHSRRLGHHFVGTEHLLLGLISEESGEIASLLRALAVDPQRVRQAIEALVPPRTQTPPVGDIPFTPRADAAIDSAWRESILFGCRVVEVEHMLIALLLQRGGVAIQALQDLDVDARKTAVLVAGDRVSQMKIIERAVRPVRTSAAAKQKIREELQVHFDGIFDEELANGIDRAAAMSAAATRLGDPIALAAEFDRDVSRLDRLRYYSERWCGWRAPESAFKYLARMVAQICALEASIVFAVSLGYLAMNHFRAIAIGPLRPMLAVLVMQPATHFGLGLIYYAMRDRLWGVFGSRRSLSKVALFVLGSALFTALASAGFIMIANWTRPVPVHLIAPIGLVAVLTAAVQLYAARFQGPAEIGNAIRACLPIKENHPDIADR